MGYVLTSAVMPDTALISACAQYITGEDSAGAIQFIATMTASSPAGWHALAAAADHAADDGNDSDAAELIFAMQRSLLGKRRRAGNQPFRAEPLAALPASQPADESAAPISRSFALTIRREPALAPPSKLAETIFARQAMARDAAEDWMLSSAYLATMAGFMVPEFGQLVATA